jgi:hypothetical protein
MPKLYLARRQRFGVRLISIGDCNLAKILVAESAPYRAVAEPTDLEPAGFALEEAQQMLGIERCARGQLKTT